MKITYEFDTCSENYDHHELITYQNAQKMLSTLSDITNQLRQWYKYDERGSIPVDEIYDKIWDIINDNNVSLEEMGY